MGEWNRKEKKTATSRDDWDAAVFCFRNPQDYWQVGQVGITTGTIVHCWTAIVRGTTRATQRFTVTGT